MRDAYPWNAIVAEGLGTFLFFLVGIGAAYMTSTAFPGGAVPGGLVTVALAHGLALAVIASAFGAISGAHVNPAVTFGLWLAGKLESSRAAAYVIAQLIGALAAAVVVRYVTPEEIPAAAGLPALGAGTDAIQGTVIEAGLTMLLLAAVFGTAVDPRRPAVGGLAIGIAVAAGIMFGGPLTGGALNPARWFGPAVVAGDVTSIAIYTLGPLVGAGIVAIVYRYLFLPEANAQTGAAV
jgi:aquaporin Z